MVIKITEYKNRANIATEITKRLPVFVIHENEIFEAKYVSKQYFRDQEAIFEPDKNGNLTPRFPEGTKQLKLKSDQLICSTREEAEHKILERHSEWVKISFAETEKKYLEMKKFMYENPEFFLFFIFINILTTTVIGIPIEC